MMSNPYVYHVSVVGFLCAELECTPETLGEVLREPLKRAKAATILGPLWLCPTYLGDPFYVVTFKGFAPAANKHKIGSQTVEEYLKFNRRLELKYPDLPCLNGCKYDRSYVYPMEVLYIRGL
jgi:hypothetical protein